MPSLSHTLGRACYHLPGGRRWLQRMASAGGRPRAVIFMLHRVLADPTQCYDPEMAVSAPAFAAFCLWLREQFEPVTLQELPQHLAGGKGAHGRPCCALTFDDGWQDTYTHALPWLRQHQLPATVFLPLHFIGTSRQFWQDRLTTLVRFLRTQPDGGERFAAAAASFAWFSRQSSAGLDAPALRAQLGRRSRLEAEAFVAALDSACSQAPPPPERTFLNWQEVAEMRSCGVSFGSHTLDHTRLGGESPGEADRQLRLSRAEMSERLGETVTTISYPWGSLGPLSRAQAAAAGYQYGVTTDAAWLDAGTDPLRWPRLAISDAQLGWQGGPSWHPGGIQVHLARARRRASPPPAGSQLRPLRVGFFVDNPDAWGRHPIWNLGGSELQILRQIESLTAPYFAPELYFLRPPSSGWNPDLPWPVFVATPGGRWSSMLGLYRLLRRRHPDVVHSLFQESLYRGVPAARWAGIETVISARRNAGYWKRRRDRWALRFINRMVTAWQTNSDALVAQLSREEGIPPCAVEILPNWLDLQRFAPATPAVRSAARRRLGLGDDDFVVVCVANYRPVKNLELLIAAAAQLIPQLEPARFLLVGSGGDGPRLKSLAARAGVQDRVRLTGESSAVEDYLAAADVGCLPSLSEGCSNAVLEYMAAGLATALSDIPANRSLTADGLFRSGNAGDLANLLLRLYHDPEMRATLAAANRRRAEQYGTQAFQDRVQAHFLRAAGNILRR